MKKLYCKHWRWALLIGGTTSLVTYLANENIHLHSTVVAQQGIIDELREELRMADIWISQLERWVEKSDAKYLELLDKYNSVMSSLEGWDTYAKQVDDHINKLEEEIKGLDETVNQLFDEITTLRKQAQEEKAVMEAIDKDRERLEAALKQAQNTISVYQNSNPLLRKDCFVSTNPHNQVSGIQCENGTYFPDKEGNIRGPFGQQLYSPQTNGENAKAYFEEMKSDKK